MERKCNDYGSKRAIELYARHKYKLENQWINPLQGINSGLGTANLSLYNYQTVDFVECSFLAQDPLMNNIFDILSTTPLSKGGKLKIIGYDDNNESLITEIEQLALKYKVKDTLEKAIRSCFVYGGCLIYLDYDGLDNNLEEPLDLNRINGNSFRGFRHIDPILCSALDVNTIEVAKEDYMEPNKWSITGLGVVHKSHLVKFEYNSPELILKPLCMYFGMPLTQLLKADVANANLVSQGLANLVNKIRRTFIKMDKTSFSSEAIESISNRLRLMQEVENNFTIFPIDYSEDIVQLTTSLQGFQEVIDAFYNLIASKTGITINKLKGSSTGGLNANTSQAESDKNFVDKIETIRQSLVKDKLLQMYRILANTMVDNNNLLNTISFDYEFNPLFNLSEREIAETININLDIATKLEQLGVEPEQCIKWLKSNKINGMEMVKLEEDSNWIDE